MLPLELFRSSQFTGANLVTLAVYAGLGGMFFFVVVNLQDALGYSALEVGRRVDARDRDDAPALGADGRALAEDRPSASR